ncbi:MAG: MerR family DNA-binding transcriptional regulator [Dinoroseobacter sp.]|nr:MerR family DNA-binding transcriptional regulator [Dinoroseobacter sp.]
MAEETISFKEMCAQFDVTPRTLRYYEYIELLAPIREGRSRFYTSREVARMKLILRGRRFGFSLEEIRQWLLMYEQQGSAVQNKVWVDSATAKLEELQVQHEELQRTIDELKALRDQVAASL